jgi:phosphoglycolate phosphatase
MIKNTLNNLDLPHAVIFDWDNTLVSTWDAIAKVINHVLAHFDMDPWTIEDVKQKTHLSAKDYFPIIFKERSQEALSVLQKYVVEGHSEQLQKIKPMQGAAALLQRLQILNIPCAILSNKQGDRLRMEVEHFGWNPYFTGVFGSTDFKEDKPSALPILEILKKFNWEPSQTWFVGDTPVDWLCAKNSGCVPISVIKECLELEALYVFDGCDALRSLFSKD